MATALFIATAQPAAPQAGLAAVVIRAGPFASRIFGAGRKGRITLPRLPSGVREWTIDIAYELLTKGWPSGQHNQIFITLEGEGWRRYTPARACFIEPEVAPHECQPCDLVFTPSGTVTSATCNRREEPALVVNCSAEGCSFPDYEAAEAARLRQIELDRQAAAAQATAEQARLAELEKQRFLARARCDGGDTQSAGSGAYAAKLVGKPSEEAVAGYTYPGISGRTRLYRAAGAYVTVLFDVARLEPPASIRTARQLLCVSLVSTTNNTIEYFYVDRANVVPYVPSKFEQVFHQQ